MKKLLLLLWVVFIGLNASAQLFLSETFNYNTPRLASLPGDPPASATNNLLGVWYNTGKTADSNSGSIHVHNEPLFYPGYIHSGSGKAANIHWDGSGANTRVDVIRFLSHPNRITTGVLYYAFLLNVENIRSFSTSAGEDANDWRDILCVAEGGSEILGNSFRGRFFLQQDAENPQLIRYSISKNTAFTAATPPDAFGEINAGQTYLFVIKQTFTGGTDCRVEVIHNPPIAATEPTSGWINGRLADVNTFAGTYGVALRRRNLGSTANVFLSGLRVARTYAEAVGAVISGLNNQTVKPIFAENQTIVTPSEGNLRIYTLTGSQLVNDNTLGRYTTQLQKGVYIIHFTNLTGNQTKAKVLIR